MVTFTLETAVERARAYSDGRARQGERTPRTSVRKDEQRRMARSAGCARVRSAVTILVNHIVASLFSVPAGCQRDASGQLPFLGSEVHAFDDGKGVGSAGFPGPPAQVKPAPPKKNHPKVVFLALREAVSIQGFLTAAAAASAAFLAASVAAAATPAAAPVAAEAASFTAPAAAVAAPATAPAAADAASVVAVAAASVAADAASLTASTAAAGSGMAAGAGISSFLPQAARAAAAMTAARI